MEITCDCGRLMEQKGEPSTTSLFKETYYTCEHCEITVAIQEVNV